MVHTICMFLQKNSNCLLILVTLFLSIIVIQDLHAQEMREEPTFQVQASKLNPDLNEPVIITAEYTAPRDLEYVVILFSLGLYKDTIYQESDKIKLIRGDEIWRGSLKKGEVIKKQIEVSFSTSLLYNISSIIKLNYDDRGFQRTFTFSPAGAFEHDKRNQSL